MLRFNLIIAGIFLAGVTAYSSTTTIQASGFSFTPSQVTVNIGDTIKWVWVNGTHTTTSTSVPAGATSWDAPLDNTHTSFIYVTLVSGLYNYDCTYHSSLGMTGTITVNPVGIKHISGSIPEKFYLYQNYPNPFNPSTTIKFDLPSSGEVSLIVYGVTGEKVTALVNQHLEAGNYSADWQASNYPSGIYFYRLAVSGSAGEYKDTKRLVLLK